MRSLTDIHPKVAAGALTAALAAIALAFLQKVGVQADVDLSEPIRDLIGLDLGTLDVSVRQAVTALGALAGAYLWPEETASELDAADPADLDESTEADGGEAELAAPVAPLPTVPVAPLPTSPRKPTARKPKPRKKT